MEIRNRVTGRKNSKNAGIVNAVGVRDVDNLEVQLDSASSLVSTQLHPDFTLRNSTIMPSQLPEADCSPSCKSK